MIPFRYIGGSLVALSILYSGFYFTVAFNVEKQLRSEIKTLTSKGHKASAGNVDMSGFPYRIVAHVDNVKFTSQDKTLSAKAKRLTATSHLWTPGHWVIDLEKTEFQLFNKRYRIKDDNARISIRDHDEQGLAFALDFARDHTSPLLQDTKLKSEMPLTDAFMSARFNTETSKAANALYENSLFDFFFRAKNGENSAEARGTVTGPDPKRLNKDGLASWRDAGGIINFNQAKLGISGTELVGTGSLSLDENFHLLGSFSGVKTGKKSVADVMNGFGFNGPTPNELDQPNFNILLQNGQLIANGVTIGPLLPVLD